MLRTEEAIKRCDENDFCIIFMDINMPIMDGYQATEHLLTQYRDQCPPIVAVTAMAYDEDIQRSLEVGMARHICKPIKVSELKSVLKEYKLIV